MDSIPFLQFTQLTFLPYVFRNWKDGSQNITRDEENAERGDEETIEDMVGS